MKLRYYFYLLLLFVLCVPMTNTNGQDKNKDKNWEFCQNYSNWGGRPSFNEVREMTIAKPELLTVDGRQTTNESKIKAKIADLMFFIIKLRWM